MNLYVLFGLYLSTLKGYQTSYLKIFRKELQQSIKSFLSEMPTNVCIKRKWVPEVYLEPSQIFIFQLFISLLIF